jgi:hypothetical protein
MLLTLKQVWAKLARAVPHLAFSFVCQRVRRSHIIDAVVKTLNQHSTLDDHKG